MKNISLLMIYLLCAFSFLAGKIALSSPVISARIGKGMKGNSIPGQKKEDRLDLDTDSIAVALKKDAFAVVRSSDDEITVDLNSGLNIKHKSAITILSEKGEKEAIIYAFYSRSEPIRSLKAFLYDTHGKFIKQIKENDFSDLSAIDGFSMFLDERYKKYVPTYSIYPYTIVYELESKTKDTFYLPSWAPQPESGIAVQSSSFTVIMKNHMELRIHEQNVEPAKLTELNGDKLYSWKLENKQAFQYEPFSGNSFDYTPNVSIAPVRFKVKGMQGSFTNWNEYGKWIYDHFLVGADEVPGDTKAHILSLTASAKEPIDKARIVYSFVQEKMRYVGVQIGIGGFKTESAATVDKQGYGDCKGLSNYTRSLLKVCGIESYYTEIYAGNQPRKLYPDFANLGSFNHIILCIPSIKDTTWLECTSKDAPFGYLGNFTDNRDAIMVTPEGGKMVHTRKYPEQENLQVRTSIFKLQPDGSTEGEIETSFSGIQFENREAIKDLPQKERDEKLKEYYPLDRLEINSFDLKFIKTASPLSVEKIKFSIPLYGQSDGKDLVVNACPFNGYTTISYSRRKRKLPIEFIRGFIDTDSTHYIIPKGYEAGETSDHILKSVFGEYSVHFKRGINKIECIRSLHMHAGKYDADKYQDYVHFRQEVKAFDEIAIRIQPKV